MLGTLDFAVSEHWAPFNFPYSTALKILLYYKGGAVVKVILDLHV